ncbi:MAG: hypothetical protein MN733_09660 [Nitrososphaera sp.]|nr:hypothetical protein [Nitrososphaera sp.]
MSRKPQNDEPIWIDPDYEPDLESDGNPTIGTATTIQEYSLSYLKSRKKVRRRPIGFLRDDWPDIVD